MSGTALLELGGVVVGLAMLARIAGRVGMPAVPLYLVGGLAFGKGGLLPLVRSEGFMQTGARISGSSSCSSCWASSTPPASWFKGCGGRGGRRRSTWG